MELGGGIKLQLKKGVIFNFIMEEQFTWNSAISSSTLSALSY